ncbi:MAG: DNA-formamidopyrimidine glycosylase [Candidatus Pacebacteria bacterium]|nr:DNA-formamidopyrimidine glycosylase [Candidatus Paceibacterota bacterium]
MCEEGKWGKENNNKKFRRCDGIFYFYFCDNISNMPELPEVQTIANDLEKKIVGKTIIGFWSDYKKAVRPSFAKFRRGVTGRKIIGIERYGKMLVLNLSAGRYGLGGDYSIVIHLKMIGHLLFKELGRETSKFFEEKINQYIHHIIYFKNGDTLAVSDLRKFAWLRLAETTKVGKMKEIVSLGIDALGADLSFKRFEKLLEKRQNSKIGTALLDQKWLAGVGNIYRSEILFEAKLHPERIIKRLTVGERKKLHQALRTILKKAVKMRGTSTIDYRDTAGKKGRFQNALRAYGREGEKCLKCGTKIEKIKLAQRSVFFCPKCQK